METIGILVAILLLFANNAFPYIIQRIQEAKMLSNYPYLLPMWSNISGAIICLGLIIWLVIKRGRIEKQKRRESEDKLGILISKLDDLITVIKEWKEHR